LDVVSRPLVGRVAEREAIGRSLGALRERRGGVVGFEGEPGIGKSVLLGELAARAEGTGCTVLRGRASEFEFDLPFAIWTEALDRHLSQAGERRLERLGLEDPTVGVAGARRARGRRRGGR
jgi:predicted ATPase